MRTSLAEGGYVCLCITSELLGALATMTLLRLFAGKIDEFY